MEELISDTISTSRSCSQTLLHHNKQIARAIGQCNNDTNILQESKQILRSMQWFGFITNWFKSWFNATHNEEATIINTDDNELDRLSDAMTFISKETDNITKLIDNQRTNLDKLSHISDKNNALISDNINRMKEML